jgi:hypothetical protein
MMGFKNFHCARVILSGIEVMHMIRKGQMKTPPSNGPLPTNSIHWLRKQFLPYRNCLVPPSLVRHNLFTCLRIL